MKTKHLLTSALLCLAFSFSARAQHEMHGDMKGHGNMHHEGKMNHEKVATMKVGFLTRKMDLDVATAQKFWPIYNAFEAELKGLKEAHHKSMKEAHENWDSQSDQQKEKLMQSRFEMEEKELDIKKKYHADFKKVLSMDQMAKFYHAQEAFKKHLIREMRDHHKIKAKSEKMEKK